MSAEDNFFGGKQKFKIKQLKLKKFIKYVLQLIITTLNATFEVPSLRTFP